METVEELKETKRSKAQMITKKMQEALDELRQLEESGRGLYVNGESEELRTYCIVEKGKIKMKVYKN